MTRSSLKGFFLTGAFLLAKMGILQATFLIWGMGLLRFLPQKWTVMALKRPFSKLYLNWTGSEFRLLIWVHA